MKLLKSPLIWAITLAVLCSSCVPNNQVDASFITHEPCAPPCWQGLELGKSNRQEALEIVGSLPFIVQDSIKEYDVSYLYGDDAVEVVYTCLADREKSICGSIVLVDNIIKRVYYKLMIAATLEQVVSLYGNPDFLAHGLYSPQGGCVIRLFWPEEHFIVSYLNTNSSAICDQLKTTGTIPDELRLTEVSLSLDEDEFEGRLPAGDKLPWAENIMK